MWAMYPERSGFLPQRLHGSCRRRTLGFRNGNISCHSTIVYSPGQLCTSSIIGVTPLTVEKLKGMLQAEANVALIHEK